MPILDQLANSQFSYAAGASGTVTVPAGLVVTSIACHATSSGATLTITPKGALQTATAGPAIPIPAPSWFGLQALGQIGAGTILAFSGTDSYFVGYAQLGGV